MAESWYWPEGSKNALRSPSNREKCVCMPEPNSSAKGLGHEGGQAALLQGDLLDDGAEGHDVVRHGQGVGEAQVDLVLAGAALMVGELHRDPHLLQHEDGVTPEVVGGAAGHVVEVAGVVGGADTPVGVAVDQVELDLRVDVAREARLGDAGELALEHGAGVGAGGLAVRGEDVAEHTGHAVGSVSPWEHLEGGGVGGEKHVGLEDTVSPSMAEPSKPIPSSKALSTSAGRSPRT